MLNKLNELRKGKEEGFTLIELLVVILIIGVLSAIALPIFLNQQKEAAKASVKSDVRNTVTNVATYLVSNPTASDVSGVTVVKSGTNQIVVDGGYTDYTVEGSVSGVAGTYTFYSANTTVGQTAVPGGTYYGTEDYA